MRRDEIIRRLRELRGMKAAVEQMEQALDMLTEEERDIIETIYVFREKNGAEKLCEKLMIERAAVYRRAKKAINSLEKLM